MLEVMAETQIAAFRFDVTFSCQTSGIIAVYGRSGCGKTTLANVLAGLLSPKRGSIRLKDDVLFDSSKGIDLPPERRRIGYVFQEGRLFPHLTVRGNLAYGRARATGRNPEVTPDQVIELLGLEHLLARRPHDLSGGEKQRVALGRALLSDPNLLLMDEPLAALDQGRKDEVLPFIERLHAESSVPIVYITHAMDEILRLAETLVLMSNGRVEAVGPLAELTSRLDLRPLTGRYEAGSVLDATVLRHDPTFALTELAFAGGTIRVPGLELAPGAALRVRIRARDVAIALQPPREISVLNVFPGVVREVSPDPGPHPGADPSAGPRPGPLVDVLLDLGGAPLWARITARSSHDLKLRPGTPVQALIKAVAIDRHALGRAPKIPHKNSKQR